MPRWLEWLLAPHGRSSESDTRPYPKLEAVPERCDHCDHTGETICCLCGGLRQCDHCACLKRGHPCCWCGVWLKDIDPIVVAGSEMTCNPIAMEYGRRYGFRLAGPNQPWCYVVKHRDESIQIIREQQIWRKAHGPLCESVETVVEDCRRTAGWLNERTMCGRTHEPWCYYHEMMDAMALDLHYIPRLHGQVGED